MVNDTIHYALMAEHPNDADEYCISDVRALSEEEYQAIRAAMGAIGQFGSSYSLYDMFEDNCQELVDLFEQAVEPTPRNQEDDYHLSMEMNRQLMNCLSGFRSFLDHYETRLKRKLSQADFEEIWEQRTKLHFDTSFAYRFSYKLRNYVQHCGLPLSGVTQELVPTEGQGLVFRATLFFVRDELLRNYDAWTVVKKDLQQQPEHINALPIIEELRRCVEDIAMNVASLDIYLLDNQYRLLGELTDEVAARFQVSRPTIARLIVSPEGRRRISYTPFPMYALLKMQTIGDALHRYYQGRKAA